MIWLIRAALLLAGLVTVAGFHLLAPLHYEFRPKLSMFPDSIAPVEMTLYGFYAVAGTFTLWCLLRLLLATPIPGMLARRAVLLENPRICWIFLPVLFGLLLVADRFVVLGAPVTDDEMTFDFIARTLLLGRVINPLPGDEAFFANQWIVLDDHGWYGKYPIGHPLLLALGRLAGLQWLVVPLVTCACFALTVLIARELGGPRLATVSALLLAISPQFVLTGATQLSQPPASFCMLLALWALLRLERDGAPHWAALAGFALGFGILVRPMPGVLFLGAALLHFALILWRKTWSDRGKLALLLGIPLAIHLAVFAWVNRAQTGGVMRTGYHVVHTHLGSVVDHGAEKFTGSRVASSFLVTFIRQNFWLFGWPLSFVLLPFAARDRGMALLWAIVAAAYAYRFLIPKTVVSVTGPVYVAEIVPLLAILSASGLLHLPGFLERHNFEVTPAHYPAALIAATLTAALMFLPYPVRDLRHSGTAVKAAQRLLDELGVKRALIFANYLTNHPRGDSWAIYAPNPSPTLDDDVIYVRMPHVPDPGAAIHEFWSRRFADRPAYVFHIANDVPTLVPLGPSPPRIELSGGPRPPPISLSGEASRER